MTRFQAAIWIRNWWPAIFPTAFTFATRLHSRMKLDNNLDLIGTRNNKGKIFVCCRSQLWTFRALHAMPFLLARHANEAPGKLQPKNFHENDPDFYVSIFFFLLLFRFSLNGVSSRRKEATIESRKQNPSRASRLKLKFNLLIFWLRLVREMAKDETLIKTIVVKKPFSPLFEEVFFSLASSLLAFSDGKLREFAGILWQLKLLEKLCLRYTSFKFN